MWVEAALHTASTLTAACVELSISLVDSDTMQNLNFTYRKKNKPTNVLSFPTSTAAELPFQFLGDLVICPEVLIKEAAQYHLTLPAHFAHIVVHGTLHLLGFDHETPEDANQMEPLETKIVMSLGYSDPYGVNHPNEC